MGMGQSISRETQANFDPRRYQGKWYEIAKYPIYWERDCESATADYVWDEERKVILVTNTCFSGGRVIRIRKGEAKPYPDDMSKAVLTFTDGMPSGPPAPYWVHCTDYDNFALVGGPSGKYLWVLSRRERITKKEARKVLSKAAKYGYNPHKLIANPSVVVEESVMTS